jgi:secondary thiamine-phosphate synthase enzyme
MLPAATAVGRYGSGMWAQGEIRLEPVARGFHLITREVLGAIPRIAEVEVGLLYLFIRHTSASLTLNENASPDVRDDFESYFNEVVPEDARYWTHTLEGADDMPAHIKSSLLGPSLTIPVAHGRLALGTWQGIYLCEHRDDGGPRSLVATLHGEPQSSEDTD